MAFGGGLISHVITFHKYGGCRKEVKKKHEKQISVEIEFPARFERHPIPSGHINKEIVETTHCEIQTTSARHFYYRASRPRGKVLGSEEVSDRAGTLITLFHRHPQGAGVTGEGGGGRD